MLKRFGEEYRLKIRADECGERVIPGRRGHLWFDGPELCLTILDGPPISAKRLKVLVGTTGSVWQGIIGRNDHGRRVQDAEVRGIRPERYREAIRLAGCKARKRHPGASPEVLARATAARLKRRTATEPSQPLERTDGLLEGVRYQVAPSDSF